MVAPLIPCNEMQRLNALHTLGVLFTPAEERFDRITRLASHLFDAPIALVSLVADKCQWFKSAQGIAANEMPREISFCGHTILEHETLVVEDTAQDIRFADNPLVTEGPGIRFYAGHPLRAADGSHLGALCVADRVPRTLSSQQRWLLRSLAAMAEAELRHEPISDTQLALIHSQNDAQRKLLIDNATRVWNHAAILRILDGEFARAQRGAFMCVAVVQIEHARAEGDAPQVADAVMSESASRIRSALAGFDAVGRCGETTFMVLMNDCTIKSVMQTAEQIRALIADAPIVTPVGAVAATVSVGVAAYRKSQQDAGQLLAAAHDALTRAREGGRSLVQF